MKESHCSPGGILFMSPIIFYATSRGKPEVSHTDISLGNTEDAN